MWNLIKPDDLDQAYKEAPPGGDLAGVTSLVIPHVSHQFTFFLRRDLDYGTHTVYVDADGSRNIWLDAYPIDTGETLTVSYDTAMPPVYGADTLLTANEDYWVYDTRGKIELLYFHHRKWPKAFKVVYTGGLLTADGVGCPDTIKIPAIMWAMRLVNQWRDLGVVAQSFNGASVSYPPMGWIPRDIQEMLGPERRRLFG